MSGQLSIVTNIVITNLAICVLAKSLQPQASTTNTVFSLSLLTSSSCSMDPEKDISMSDLLNFMKKSEENRKSDIKALEEKLSANREADKAEFTRDIDSLKTTLKDLVKSDVKDKIVTAVRPLEAKQNTLIDEQSKLAKRILEIEKKIESGETRKENSEFDGVTSQSSKPNTYPGVPQLSSSTSQELNEVFLRKSAVQAAKKILGFSEITTQHIQQAVAHHGLDPCAHDEAEACAIYDFLYFEMKIPEAEIKNMKILRTFRPARQPSSLRLYAEFSDEATTNLINKYVRNLQPGSNVDIWVPPSLYQRFRDFDAACYSIRNGPEKVKAKVKYGDDDFILVKKSPSSHSWSQVLPDNPSPYNPNPPSYLNPSGSPPIGRNNRSNKRKTMSPSASPQKSKSHRGFSDSDIVEDAPINTTDNEESNNLEKSF